MEDLTKEVGAPVEGEFREACVYQPITGKFYEGRMKDWDPYETREAQVVTDVSTIQAQIILDEVLGITWREYVLRRACRSIPMPELVMTLDVATSPSVSEKVPPGEEAEVIATSYTPITFELWKNVGHVVILDESSKKARHPLLNIDINACAQGLVAAENSQIATELLAATDVVGEDWGVMTTPPTSDKNPLVKIQEVIKALSPHKVDFMAVDSLPWQEFLTNSYIRGMVEAKIITVRPDAFGGMVSLPGWPKVMVLTDDDLLDTSAYFGSSLAPGIALGEGPTEAARYRNETKGYDAYIIRQWLQPQVVVAGAIRELTGVTA